MWVRKGEEQGPEECPVLSESGDGQEGRNEEERGGHWEGKVKEAGERQESGNHEERKRWLANSVALGRKRMRTLRVC